MSTTCNHCGAVVPEGVRFCNSCGAPQIAAPVPSPKFCVSCGRPMTPGAAFCNNCGAAMPAANAAAKVSPATAVPPPQASGNVAEPIAPNTPQTSVPVEPPSTPVPFEPVLSATPQGPGSGAGVPAIGTPAKSGSNKGCITALIVTLIVIVLIVLAVVGGMFYVAHKVKNKVEEFAAKESQHTHDSSQPESKTTVDMSDVPGSFPPYGHIVEACPAAPQSSAEDAGNAKAIVPLQERLTWVNAWRRFNGDVEVVEKVESLGENYVNTSSSGMGFNDTKAVKGSQVNTGRLICRADLQNASTYITVNDPRLPNIIPETTHFSMSQKSFSELKTNGKFTITYEEFRHAGKLMVPVPQTAEFSRVELADVNYPVILNGQPTNLPVIHARGRFHFSGADKVKKLFSDPSFLDEDGEAFILDDPQNPMTLLWGMGPVFQVRVVSITYPVDKPQIEQQLAKEKKAVIYGIYFDFNEATIKKESQPVLKEIAEAMKNNPDWVLTVNGYTDNIGGDAYNLELSKKRSAAVKKALVDQFSIAPDRLTSGGFGASAFVDTNETLEGRARNRRVELIRQ